MSAERFVKEEAKATLRKENWVKSVVAVLMISIIPIVGFLVAEMGYALASGEEDFSFEALTESPLSAIFFVVFQLIAVVAVVLLSPLVAGCAKMFYGLAEKREAEISDIFYFFDTKGKYISAVRFMLGIIVKGIIVFMLCLLPAAIVFFISSSIYRSSFARTDAVVTLGALGIVSVILVIVGAIAALCIMHRYLFSLALYAYYGYDEKQSAEVGARVARKYSMSLVKLTFSFIPWILLLFFVVPFLYVFPYMFCSYSVSVKYLFQSYGLQFDENTEDSINRSSLVGYTEMPVRDNVVDLRKKDTSAENLVGKSGNGYINQKEASGDNGAVQTVETSVMNLNEVESTSSISYNFSNFSDAHIEENGNAEVQKDVENGNAESFKASDESCDNEEFESFLQLDTNISQYDGITFDSFKTDGDAQK